MVAMGRYTGAQQRLGNAVFAPPNQVTLFWAQLRIRLVHRCRARSCLRAGRGYGGQVICIVPDLGLTIAITSDPTRPARSGGYFGDLMALIEGAIIPAALSEEA